MYSKIKSYLHIVKFLWIPYEQIFMLNMDFV